MAARLDFLVSASWFGLCLTMSSEQTGSLLDGLYESGFWIIPKKFIDVSGQLMLLVTAVVTIVYVWHNARAYQRGVRVSSTKLCCS